MNTTTKEALIEFSTASYTAILALASSGGGITREELKRLRDANAMLRAAVAAEETTSELNQGALGRGVVESKSPF